MKKHFSSQSGQMMTLIIIWVAVAALGIVFVNVGIQTKSKIGYAETWPTVIGKISTASAEPEKKMCGGTGEIKPVVTYDYSVAGKHYTGKKILVTDGPFRNVEKTETGVKLELQEEQDKWVEKSWGAGDTVFVFYNPEIPEDVLLHPYAPPTYQKYYFIGVIALILGIFFAGKSFMSEV